MAGAAACAVLAAGLLTGCAGTGAGAAGSGPGNGDARFVSGNGTAQIFTQAQRRAAPAVEGPTLAGGTLKLADLRGKVVVLNFWASWCAPCRAEAPALARVHAENKADGVEFVGVDMREAGPENGKAFVRTYKIDYPNLYDGDSKIAAAFRDVPPSAVPCTLIIDRQGRVAGRIVGISTYSKLNPMVAQIAAEK